MPTAVDDELEQTIEPTAEDVAAVPRSSRRSRSIKPVSSTPNIGAGEPVTSTSDTTIGVVTKPGQGSEPEKVSGYFVVLNDKGDIINDTGIPTEQFLEAARNSGLSIYIKKNGQIFRGQLGSSGHRVTILDRIIPGNDLRRAMQQPAGEQLRLMSQHMDNSTATEHPTAPSSPTESVRTAPSVQPTVRLPIQPVSSPQPAASPIAESLSPSTSPPLSFEIPSVTPVPSTSTSTRQVTIPQSESTEGQTGPMITQGPSAGVVNNEPPSPAYTGIPTPAPVSSARTSATPSDPQTGSSATAPPPRSDPSATPESPIATPFSPSIPRSAEEVSPATNPEAFASPTGPALPDTPGTITMGDQAGQLSDSNRPRKPGSSREAPATAASSPTFGRRPRRDRQNFRPSLPSTAVAVPVTASALPTTPDQSFSASPAIAPGAPQTADSPVSTSAGQTSASTDTVQPTGASTTPSPSVPPAGDQSSPARSQTPPSRDHQAARPRTNDSQFPIQPTSDESVGEQAIDPLASSPAFVAGGQPSAPSAALQPATSPDDEQIGTAPLSTNATTSQRAATDSGPLVGYNDPRTIGPEAFEPLTAPTSRAPEPSTARGTETPTADSTEVVSGDQQQAAVGQLRASKVETQRRAQWESSDRARQWKAIQQGQKAKQIPVMFESNAERVAMIYKRSWQIAQEVAEDTALSMTDFFLFSGPVVVGLYFLRWVGGNMMGRLFTFQFGGVELERVPGYSLSDPIDYVRHMKFLAVATWTGAIYGLIFFILWLIANPEEAARLGLKLLTDLF